MTRKIAPDEDIIDIRDVIERFEELEELKEIDGKLDEDDKREFELLVKLLGDIKGYGGDENWRGDWYPITLIRNSYFETYAQEFAEDVGAVDRDAKWPNNCIDWAKAAEELLIDYSMVEFDGIDYWYR